MRRLAERSPALISPIQTSYSGYKFRSRLEARWAVFFTALGLQWVYEPEGFVLQNGVHYLPDFLVTSPTGLKQWYEIKPEGVTTDPKFDAFKQALEDAGRTDPRQSSVHVALLSGDPLSWIDQHVPSSWSKMPLGGVCPRCGAFHNEFSYHPMLDWGDEIAVACWPCDTDTPGGGGHDNEQGVLGLCYPHKGTVCMQKEAWLLVMRRLKVAAVKARSARFEHGESPTV